MWAVLLAVTAALIGGGPNDAICSASGWCWERPLPQGDPVGGAWGTGPKDLWLVGAGGRILRFDGKWRAVEAGVRVDLHDVWGSASDDVWAVGDRGTLLHGDGTRWSIVDVGTTSHLRAIWGSGRSDVWVVGGDGTVLHFDGARWAEVNGGGRYMLLGVGGIGGVVWVTGARGVLLRSQGGGALTPIATNIRAPLGRVIARAANDITVVAELGPNLHFDGQKWSPIPRDPEDLFAAWDRLAIDHCGALYRTDLKGGGPIGETGADLMLADSSNYRMGLRLPGRALGIAPRCTPPPLLGLHGVWLFADGTGWSVGLDGALLQRGEAGWRRVLAPIPGDLTGIWASGPADVWVAGATGLFRWDGKSWNVADSQRVEVVWGTAPDDVQSAGEDGLVRSFDGHRWTTIATDVNTSFLGIWTSPGQIFVVGGEHAFGRDKEGLAMHRAGGRWTRLAVARVLNGVWGSSPTDVWAVGDGGTLLHFNGRRWSPTTCPSSADLLSVGGRGRDDVWAGARDGTLLHFDGAHWSTVESGTQNPLNAVQGSGFGVAAAGGNGTILVHRR